MARKLSFSPIVTSKAWTPFHDTYNFLINDYKYTSKFPDVIDSLLGMVRANIIK
jgi:hypothetical protein